MLARVKTITNLTIKLLRSSGANLIIYRSIPSISVRIFSRQFADWVSVTVAIVVIFVFCPVMDLRRPYMLLPVMRPIQVFRTDFFRRLGFAEYHHTVYQADNKRHKTENQENQSQYPKIQLIIFTYHSAMPNEVGQHNLFFHYI